MFFSYFYSKFLMHYVYTLSTFNPTRIYVEKGRAS